MRDTTKTEEKEGLEMSRKLLNVGEKWEIIAINGNFGVGEMIYFSVGKKKKKQVFAGGKGKKHSINVTKKKQSTNQWRGKRRSRKNIRILGRKKKEGAVSDRRGGRCRHA